MPPRFFIGRRLGMNLGVLYEAVEDAEEWVGGMAVMGVGGVYPDSGEGASVGRVEAEWADGGAEGIERWRKPSWIVVSASVMSSFWGGDGGGGA